MKRQLALIPAALLIAATLTACASEDQGDPIANGSDGSSENTLSECAAPGSVSEALALTGDFGESVEITSELPAQASVLEKSTIHSNDGAEITTEDEIITVVQVFNGRDGSLMERTTTLLSINETYADWVLQSINCSNVGDRVAVVVPAIDVFGEDGIDSFGPEGPGADDSLVIVSDFTRTKADFVGSLLEQAEGETVAVPAGLPEVEVDETGFPEITIPEGEAAPESLTIQTLVKGDGDVVEDGDSVYVHYRGVIWETGEEFDSSWSRGTHIAFSTAGVIGGFREALVGQTVGSRVISIVPAEDGGYGAATLKSQGHAEDAVMVFVLDILGANDFPPIN